MASARRCASECSTPLFVILVSVEHQEPFGGAAQFVIVDAQKECFASFKPAGEGESPTTTLTSSISIFQANASIFQANAFTVQAYVSMFIVNRTFDGLPPEGEFGGRRSSGENLGSFKCLHSPDNSGF